MHIYIHTHLEKTCSFVQIFFIDFSSAFDTIQPHLMASKLLKLNIKLINPGLILWIIDFVVSRSQTVPHQAVFYILSSSHSISTGSPQSTVLSPILCFHVALRPRRQNGLLGAGTEWEGDDRVKARPRKPPEKDRRDRGPPPEQWKY